mgnify:CR=1 FL=1
MAKKTLNVQINEELYNWLKSYADEKGLSMRQALEEILKDYSQPRPKISPKGIVLGKIEDVILQQESKCALCNRTLKTGYRVKWIENLGHICLRCYFNRFYDKSLADKYLKKRELEATIRALRRKADELTEEIEKKQVILNIHKINKELNNLIMVLKEIRNYPELYDEKYEELFDKLDMIEQMLSGIIIVIEKEFKPSPKPVYTKPSTEKRVSKPSTPKPVKSRYSRMLRVLGERT